MGIIMPVLKVVVCLCLLAFLSGCAAVAVGGAVVGTTGKVVGTTVSTTAHVAGGAVKLAVPGGGDEDED